MPPYTCVWHSLLEAGYKSDVVFFGPFSFVRSAPTFSNQDLEIQKRSSISGKKDGTIQKEMPLLVVSF